MSITYTFVVRNAGAPTTGLTPVFNDFRDVATTLNVTTPPISEIGGGFYKFTVDWSSSPYDVVDSIVFQIYAGVTVTDPSEAYIVDRINQADQFYTVLNSVGTVVTTITNQCGAIQTDIDGIEVSLIDLSTDVAAVQTDATTLLAGVATLDSSLSDLSTDLAAAQTDITTLVEIETGKWQITTDSKLKLYTQADVLIQEFDLVDINGSPTYTNPASRIPV